jgi:hypothetical protein
MGSFLEKIKNLFKRNGAPTNPDGVSGGKSTAIIALIINVLVAVAKAFGVDIPNDVIISLNTLLVFVWAWFQRRSIDN